MPHRYSIGFRSGDMLDSVSLARQWSSWRCAWGRYHVVPAAQFFRREEIMLCFSMSHTCLHSWFPLKNCNFPLPTALMQQQQNNRLPLEVWKSVEFIFSIFQLFISIGKIKFEFGQRFEFPDFLTHYVKTKNLHSSKSFFN
ncbi:hypothetical protein GOODEAATRI_034569 [Goodea atripinnis]|uniref:Uncharacterized protein n=1 Tax=Goodea atripinnis TaxID=208336 RepID=A0ABV0P096_9TELE